MKAFGSIARPSLAALLLCGMTGAPAVLAQDSAFLACERFADRGQRIACLEDALEEATGNQPAPATPAPAAPARVDPPATATAPPATPAATPAPATPAVVETAPAAEDEAGPSLLERLRNFGRDDTATISTDAEGQDQLHDTVTALEKRRDMWVVTLAGGQVWMQDYPRALDLREGDAVTIYQAGFGNGYRLSNARSSGFIRVKRMR